MLDVNYPPPLPQKSVFFHLCILMFSGLALRESDVDQKQQKQSPKATGFHPITPATPGKLLILGWNI